MTTFYQITLNGRYSGQDVKNILWYRDASLFADALAFNGLMDALLSSIRQQIWNTQAPLHIRGYGLMEIMSSGYTLVSISGLAYSDAHVLISDTPVVEAVNEAGLVSGDTNGPASYVALRANLEPSFGPGIGLPKKGYLAVGPLIDTTVGNDGKLGGPVLGWYQSFGDNLATNVITTLPASDFFPIRVKLVYVAGLLVSIGYKDISDFTVNPIAKQRRSRLPEA